MVLRYHFEVACEAVEMFIRDLLMLPVFWRALRRTFPSDSHDYRVAEAAMGLGMSYMDRVSYADAKAKGEVL